MAMWRERLHDLLITDSEMPGTATSWCARSRRTGGLPVLVITGVLSIRSASRPNCRGCHLPVEFQDCSRSKRVARFRVWQTMQQAEQHLASGATITASPPRRRNADYGGRLLTLASDVMVAHRPAAAELAWRAHFR
jgi:hypothetical protein